MCEERKAPTAHALTLLPPLNLIPHPLLTTPTHLPTHSPTYQPLTRPPHSPYHPPTHPTTCSGEALKMHIAHHGKRYIPKVSSGAVGVVEACASAHPCGNSVKKARVRRVASAVLLSVLSVKWGRAVRPGQPVRCIPEVCTGASGCTEHDSRSHAACCGAAAHRAWSEGKASWGIVCLQGWSAPARRSAKRPRAAL